MILRNALYPLGLSVSLLSLALACTDQAPSSASAPLAPTPPAAVTDMTTPDESAAPGTESPGTSGNPADEVPAPGQDVRNEGGGVGALEPPASGGAADPAGGEGNSNGATAAPDPGALLGSAVRPQLGTAAAAVYDLLPYLAQAGN